MLTITAAPKELRGFLQGENRSRQTHDCLSLVTCGEGSRTSLKFYLGGINNDEANCFYFLYSGYFLTKSLHNSLL